MTTPEKLEAMLLRLPPAHAQRVRAIARSTRRLQASVLREAVEDLLAKYATAGEERPRG